jgi:hypothetical protein
VSRVLLLGLLLLTCFSISAYAQKLPPPEPLMPEEYDPDEFALWAHDLRRFEVVTVGTYPLTFLLTSLVYDFSVYAANGFSPEYSMGSQRDSTDIAIIAGSAAGVSVVIGVVDLIINTNKRNKKEVPVVKNEQ